jgi:predicted MPP superfamily phosphohydrolase
LASDAVIGLLTIAQPDAAWLDGLGIARLRAALVSAATAGISIVAVRNGLAPPSTARVAITLPDLHDAFDGFRIVQISDIHIGPLLDRRFAAEVTARVNALEPDLIAVTGDVVDGRVGRLGAEVEPFKELRAPHGVWFVTGNHDFYSGADLWTERLSAIGMRPLRNEHVTIEVGADAAFELAGVDDHHGSMLEEAAGEDLDRALQGCDPNRPVILLAHDPSSFKRAIPQRVGLQLSGHTHGGQIWPFHWAVRAAIPWVKGHHQVGASQLYVSCGTGFWGPPMRLGTKSEITLLTLHSPTQPPRPAL